MDQFKQNFDQLFNDVVHEKDDKNELFEFWDPTSTQDMAVRVYRKYAFGGLGNFHTYTTQFPFRGHDPAIVEDKPANQQDLLEKLNNKQRVKEMIEL